MAYFTTMRSSVGLAGLLAGSLSCSFRAPGPAESERGRVTIWEVTEAGLDFAMCTDAPAWRARFGNPLDAVGGALSYRVAEDGRSAEALACERAAADACAPVVPRRVYTVDGSTLRFEPSPRRIPASGFDCVEEVSRTFTLEDRGETLDIAIVTAHALVGTATACARLDEAYAEMGTEKNTNGMRDCVVSFEAKAQYVGSF
jgi:hypothetical protein